MKNIFKVLLASIISLFIAKTPLSAEKLMQDNNNGMIVRISKIEVYPQYLDEYNI